MESPDGVTCQYVVDNNANASVITFTLSEPTLLPWVHSTLTEPLRLRAGQRSPEGWSRSSDGSEPVFTMQWTAQGRGSNLAPGRMLTFEMLLLPGAPPEECKRVRWSAFFGRPQPKPQAELMLTLGSLTSAGGGQRPRLEATVELRKHQRSDHLAPHRRVRWLAVLPESAAAGGDRRRRHSFHLRALRAGNQSPGTGSNARSACSRRCDQAAYVLAVRSSSPPREPDFSRRVRLVFHPGPALRRRLDRLAPVQPRRVGDPMTALVALALIINGTTTPASPQPDIAGEDGIQIVSEETLLSSSMRCTLRVENLSQVFVASVEVVRTRETRRSLLGRAKRWHAPEGWHAIPEARADRIIRWEGKTADVLLAPAETAEFSFDLLSRDGLAPVCSALEIMLTTVRARPRKQAATISIQIAALSATTGRNGLHLEGQIELRNDGPDQLLHIGLAISTRGYPDKIRLIATDSNRESVTLYLEEPSGVGGQAGSIEIPLPRNAAYSSPGSWAPWEPLAPGTYSVVAQYTAEEARSGNGGGYWVGQVESEPIALTIP